MGCSSSKATVVAGSEPGHPQATSDDTTGGSVASSKPKRHSGARVTFSEGTDDKSQEKTSTSPPGGAAGSSLAASMAMSGSGSRALHEEEGKGEGGSGSGGGGKWIPEASTSGEGEPRRRDDWPALRTTSSFGREYTVGTVLGKGSFGEVFVATKVADGVKYAVKKIKPAKRSGEGIGFDSTSLAHDREAANREAALMKRVAGHSSVISITDHVQDDAFVYIVMEHCAGGDLMKYILNCHSFSEQVAAFLFRQMLLGVSHCHERGVAHRDIKPDNFLFKATEGEAVLKLADFGLSTRVNGPDDIITDAVGSAFFIAPEVFRRKYTLACDAWSLGVLLYLMLSGTVPFGSKATTPQEVHHSIKHDELSFSSPAWARVSSPARELVAGLLEKTVWKRYTLAQALAHPWVSDPTTAPAAPLDRSVIDSMYRFNARNRLRREALKLVASTLSAADVQKLRQQFLEMDTDTDLKVSVGELQAALKKIGMAATAEQVSAMVARLDTDSDGVIDLEEFLVATTEMQMLAHQNSVYWAFKQYDADGDGQITVDELRAAFARLGEGTARDEEAKLEEYIAEADLDGDGKVSYEEFLAMLVPEDIKFRSIQFT